MPRIGQGLAAALQILRLNHTENFLLKNMGLSLNDHDWVRPAGSELAWKEVNLFDNDFSDVLGDFLFTGDTNCIFDIGGKTDFVPSATLQGELIKNG